MIFSEGTYQCHIGSHILAMTDLYKVLAEIAKLIFVNPHWGLV